MNRFLYLNSIGLIPGPNETFEDFELRAEYCLRLKTEILPQVLQEKDHSVVVEEAFPLTQSWYGICPDWVYLFFSNEKLTPWHGGAAWIFQMEENTPTAALIQLRENFANKKKYLKFLSRKELLAHELSHVGRMMFNEPRFEEMLAYRSSPSWISRNLGPLFQSAKESFFFIFTLLFTILFDFLNIFYGNSLHATWLKLIPLGFLFLLFIRLFSNKTKLNRSFLKLKELLQSDEKANAFLYRLTDSEIENFSRSSLADIQDYIQKQSDLRWQILKHFLKTHVTQKV